MGKEELKLQIDTTITNKTLAKSISPLNVGQNMKDIVDLISTQDLQSVLNTGYVAEADGGISSLQLFGDAPFSRYFSLQLNNGQTSPNDRLSIIRAYNNQSYLSNLHNTFSGTVGVFDGKIDITQYSLNGYTKLEFNNPLSISTLKFPSKSIAGNYTLATLDDITNTAQDLQSVINIGGVAEVPNKIVAYINQGDSDNKYTQFASFTDNGLSNYIQITKQGVSLYSSSLDAISYQNPQGSIKSLDGLISLTQFKGALNTNLYFNTPIANTNIVVPAKSTIGTYTLATTDQLRPYKVYTALISQSGTNAPTVIVLENTFDGAISWSRNAPGSYFGHLMGAFIENKTFFITTKQANGFGDGGDDIHMSRISDNVIQLITISQGSTTDNVINKASIEIRVYN